MSGWCRNPQHGTNDVGFAVGANGANVALGCRIAAEGAAAAGYRAEAAGSEERTTDGWDGRGRVAAVVAPVVSLGSSWRTTGGDGSQQGVKPRRGGDDPGRVRARVGLFTRPQRLTTVRPLRLWLPRGTCRLTKAPEAALSPPQPQPPRTLKWPVDACGSSGSRYRSHVTSL